MRLQHPHPLEGGMIAWVAGVGIAVNGLSALLFFRDKHELNAKSAYLHLLADAAVSVGVVAAGIIISYTHWYWLDTVVSLGVLVVILISTWGLLADSLRLSLDAVPRNLDAAEVEQAMLGTAGVSKVDHIHIWAISTTENALTAHITLTAGQDDGFKVVAALKHELLHHNVQHATIEIDCNI